MNLTGLLPQFLLALTFLTRTPLPADLGNRIDPDAKLSDAVVFFPIIGLIVGFGQACIWLLAGLVLPSSLSAGLAIAAGLVITGALHEDGLADCADGLGATSDRKKALEIMRDSRIGTYGALALASSLLLRWAALSSLETFSGLLALLIAHSASRSAMTIALRFSEYARPEGLGKLASGPLSERDFSLAIAIPCVVAIAFGWLNGLAAVALGLLAAWGLLKYLQRRLGGYTGDGLGAIQQVCEVTVLLALVGFWG